MKFGGNATRISADSASISMDFCFFLSTVIYCYLRYTVQQKHERYRKNWSGRSFACMPREYLPNCDGFAAVFPTAPVEMYACVTICGNGLAQGRITHRVLVTSRIAFMAFSFHAPNRTALVYTVETSSMCVSHLFPLLTKPSRYDDT
jgi:hypothetical protein